MSLSSYHPSSEPEDVSPTYDKNEDIQEENMFAKRKCCFWMTFLSMNGRSSSSTLDGSGESSSVFWQRISPESAPATPTGTSTWRRKEPWWERGWKKLREWSELVAGPKWKTLIRRFKRKPKAWKREPGYGKFRYDPMSYALNFDEGPGHYDHRDEDIIGRGFSARYSLPPSAKCSLDFDKEGMPGLV